MIPETTPITPGLIARQDGGLLYRVLKVTPSTDDYEVADALNGLARVQYVQLEAGDYPVGSEWNKSEEGFRRYFTVTTDETLPISEETRPKPERSTWGRGGRNPERTNLQNALGIILANGFTLTLNDIREIVPYYGYSQGSAPGVMDNTSTKRVIRAQGVDLKIVNHHSTFIFTDGSIAPEETDLDKTKAAIDERLSRKE